MLLGAVVGAGLAVVGMTLQALVHNPLADPICSGCPPAHRWVRWTVIVSGAALFGAAVDAGRRLAGALAALLLVYALSRAPVNPDHHQPAGAGRCGGGLCAVGGDEPDPDDSAAPEIRRGGVLTWLLEGLGGANWGSLWLPAEVVLIRLVVLLAQARTLNVHLAGDEALPSARWMPAGFRAQMFVLASVVTGVPWWR